MNDTQTLSPKDALLFLRVLHGDNFSTAHWENFMVSTVTATVGVTGMKYGVLYTAILTVRSNIDFWAFYYARLKH